METMLRSRMATQSPLQRIPLAGSPTKEGVIPVPSLGEAWTKYMEAHSYRKSEHHKTVIASTFNELLTVSGLQEWHPIEYLTKDLGRRWIQWQQTPKTFPARRPPKPVTIMAKVQHVRHFLKYCVGEDWVQDNAFANLFLPVRAVSASRQRKHPFTDLELSAIIKTLHTFSAPTLPRWIRTAAQRVEFRHACLLLMVTGARANEIVQLRQEDVQQREGVWCVDLCPGEGKRFKNTPSLRVIPLHSAVLPVFLPWFQTRPAGPLFPLLTSILVTRWFSREILERAGIKRKEVSLHSFRHTLTHRLILARTYSPIQNRLLGHSLGTSVELTAYTRGLEFKIAELSEALERVTFPPLV